MKEIKNTLDAHNHIKTFLASSRDILPPLPEILVKMQSAINDSKVDARDLSQIILKDPSLTAKIMKLANSAYYRHGKHEVNTVTDAIVIMGFEAIRNVVLGISVYNIMNKLPRVEGYKHIWSHSLSCAVCSQQLAELVKVQIPESIFVAGLLHDIGKLILAQVFPVNYSLVVDRLRAKDSSLIKVEKELLFTDHAQAGELVGDFWNFPKQITHAIRHHELSYDLSDFKKFDSVETNIVVLSNMISHFVYGKEPGFPDIDLSVLIAMGEEALGCDGDKLFELINKLKSHVFDISKILDVETHEKALDDARSDSLKKKKKSSGSGEGKRIESFPLIPRSLIKSIQFRGLKPVHLEPLKEKLAQGGRGGIAAEVDSPPIIDSVAEIEFRYDSADVLMHGVGLVKWVERQPKKIVGIQFLRVEKSETEDTSEMSENAHVISSPAATTVELADNALIIRGEFASSAQEGFMQSWAKLLRGNHKELVVDISSIIRISSMAIGLLVGAQMDAAGAGKKMSIVAPVKFKRIFNIAGVEKILTLSYVGEGENIEEKEDGPKSPKEDGAATKARKELEKDNLTSAGEMLDPSRLAEEDLQKEIERMKSGEDA
ncbi:MAG: HDOD domain-containing protein [Planctomycetota bacterium]